jgi:hypothetical protein
MDWVTAAKVPRHALRRRVFLAMVGVGPFEKRPYNQAQTSVTRQGVQ